MVAIGLVGQPVGFGLVWSGLLIGLVWFGLNLLVLLVYTIPLLDRQEVNITGQSARAHVESSQSWLSIREMARGRRQRPGP